MAAGDALADRHNLLNGGLRYKHRAAVVGDHVVVFTDLDACDRDRHRRVDLHHPVACADHGYATAKHRVTNGRVAVDVTAEAVNHRAAHTFADSGIGQGVAPARDALKASGDHQHPVIAVDTFNHRGDQVHGGQVVAFGAEQHGAGAADDFGAVPQGPQASGGAFEAKEIEGIRHRVGVQRGQTVKQAGELHGGNLGGDEGAQCRGVCLIGILRIK